MTTSGLTLQADSFESVTSTEGALLIGELLASQQSLSAVDHFALDYELGGIPSHAKHYRDLIPATPPGPGQQYAFDVDLDKCSGCKSCVTACHSLNGLDEHETWRDVGLLIGGSPSQPMMQHVTTACHHCLEPACMSACPVNAYEKDSLTGIVRHLDDQCFGCQYCTLACPYDVPKYHADKGIVRKCDMCSDRLAAEEAPACVQACPGQAISIKLVDVRAVIEDAEVNYFLPAAPDPQITLPTTTYRTARGYPRNFLPADYFAVNPQHPHWPLIFMLVLTQLAVGAFTVGVVMESVLRTEDLASLRPTHAVCALAFGLLALGASTLHLGRPHLAFRAVLGLSHSWLSREIVAFGAFAALAILFTAWSFLDPEHGAPAVLGWLVVASGAVGVLCSVMIYDFTQREFWSAGLTGAKFMMTAALLGFATTWFTAMVVSATASSEAASTFAAGSATIFGRALIILTLGKLGLEASLFHHLTRRRNTALKRSALLMTRALSNFTLSRFAIGVLGGVVMPLFLLDALAKEPSGLMPPIIAALLLIACLAGELLERYLFFAAVSSPRMPGGLRR